MAKSATRNLTVGSPMKLIVSFTVPLLFGFVFQQFYNIADTAIVGRFLGAGALAAVGSTGSLNFLILGFCNGLCAGFAIPIAQAFGANDRDNVRRYVWNTVYLCAVISIILGIVTGLMSRTLLQWMNTPPDILYSANSYIQLIFLGIPATVMYNMAGGIMRSLGDSKTPVLFLIMASLINIVLDLVFILVLKLGVMGAALATVISQLVAGAACVVTIIKRLPLLHGGDRRFDRRICSKLMGIGLPMGLQYSITAIGSVILQVAVNGLGTMYVAAVAAAAKIFNLFCCVFDALATTLATYAGQNIGAKKVDRIGQGLKAATIIGIAYCVVCVVTIGLFGRQLTTIFLSAGEIYVIEKAYRYMFIQAWFYIPLLFVNILRLTIQGMGYTKVAIVAGVLEMIARTAVAFLLVPALGFDAACFASPCAWLAADAFLFPCYFSVIKKMKKRLKVAA
ncbi:MAG: MATE family efflux transporter [Clostridia bacterium]|nr:MATE family efflux transporter [Clostridia bacterium]